MAHIEALHRPSHQVATVWHPEAKGEVLHTHHGAVRVLTGPAAYQITSGQIIEISGNQPA